jgi:hypothetical protein
MEENVYLTMLANVQKALAERNVNGKLICVILKSSTLMAIFYVQAELIFLTAVYHIRMKLMYVLMKLESFLHTQFQHTNLVSLEIVS